MKQLQKIAGDDWSEIQVLLKSFEQAARDGDTKKLRDLSTAAFKFEITYLAQFNSSIKQKLQAGKQGLLTTVGNRKEPVCLCISILKPSAILFVHTRGSKGTVKEIQESGILNEIYGKKLPHLSSILIDPLDAAGTYEKLAAKISYKAADNWLADITGGRKVMASVLSSFAFWRRIEVLYLNGQEIQGVIKPFTETLEFIENPYDRYGDPVLQAAEDAFNSYHFETSIQILKQLRHTVSIRELDHKISIAISLISAYQQWDKFQHSNDDSSAAETFYKDFLDIMEQCQRFDYRFFPAKQINANVQFVQYLQDGYEAGRQNLFDEYRLADLFSNAIRRSELQLYDDAVARLYRCFEMAASLVLRKLSPVSNPDNMDWNKLRKEYHWANLDKLYNKRAFNVPDSSKGLPQKTSIGLGTQVTLAAVLADAHRENTNAEDKNIIALCNSAEKIYDLYRFASEKEGLPSLRNRSILAHGSKPLDKPSFDKFRDIIWKVCSLACEKGRWKTNLKSAQFPKIKLT